MEQELKQFYTQLPPELQQKIQMLPPEKQQEVLMQLMQKYQQQGDLEEQQFAFGGRLRKNEFSTNESILQNAMQNMRGNSMSNEQWSNNQLVNQFPFDLDPNMQLPINIQNIYNIKKFKPRFEEGGKASEKIPVEAEKDENVTTENGEHPDAEGGYLEQIANNPVTGQATYEIPNNKYNNSHEESGNGSKENGVNMELMEGDTIASNKTKITTDFKIYGKQFKGKTFKDGSDYIAKLETKVQKDYEDNVKKGLTDKVSEGTLAIILAKLGKDRDSLNELQEQVLASKKQKEGNESLSNSVAEFGKLIKKHKKHQSDFDYSLDKYLSNKSSDKLVLKAAGGLNASIAKFENFSNNISKGSSLKDIMSAYQSSGLGKMTPTDNTNYYKPTFTPMNASPVVGDFKSKIASIETNGYKNPYIAMSGIKENEAAKYSFKDLKDKAASTAIGKYQFVWSLHKNDIKRVTGVSDPDQFRYNPQAQEKFMDWFRDNQLLPQATKIKQQYQIPLSIEKIMAGIHLEGVGSKEKGKGFLGKYFSGKLGESTMAGKFKNATTNTYMDKFEDGGKIYANWGANLKKIYEKAMEKVNSGDLSIEDVRFLYEGLQNPEAKDFTGVGTVTDLTKYLFGDGDNSWIPKENASDLNFYNYKNKNLKNPPSYQEFNDNLYNIDSNILPEEMHSTWANKSDSYLKSIGDFLQYYDNQNTTQINPLEEIKQDNSVVDNSEPIDLRSLNNRNRSLNREKDFGEERRATEGRKSAEPSKADKKSIKDYLNYGLRESLPYLRNLELMNEDTINPILQQTKYDNPYDNLSTDYNIQSNLNDIDRNTLTAMANSSGNPSIRNARMVQMKANSDSAKNQLYSQKYNQEKQLENTKTMGQSQYRNQFDLQNMNLKKVFEQEKLQTIENKRQQVNMAKDKMINDYLRKQEEKQAINLSLLDTDFDWDQYKQDLVRNPEKAKANFANLKFMIANQPKSSNGKMSEDYYLDQYGIPRKKSSKEGKYGLRVHK